MEVIELKAKDCEEWLLKKHYLKRVPTISFAFGILKDETVEGVATFSGAIARFDLPVTPYELSRLVVNDGLPDNTLSWFLSQCIKKFPKPAIIVSYADENWGHHGYIYQATNWLYTGYSSGEKRIFINGEEVHRRTLYARYGTSSIPKLKEMGLEVNFMPQTGKHRYFQFAGNKQEKRLFRKEITDKYKVLPYPKGENDRYDASYVPDHKIKENPFW